MAANYNKYQKKIDKDLVNPFNLINTLVANPLSRTSLGVTPGYRRCSIGKPTELEWTEIPIFDCIFKPRWRIAIGVVGVWHLLFIQSINQVSWEESRYVCQIYIPHSLKQGRNKQIWPEARTKFCVCVQCIIFYADVFETIFYTLDCVGGHNLSSLSDRQTPYGFRYNLPFQTWWLSLDLA